MNVNPSIIVSDEKEGGTIIKNSKIIIFCKNKLPIFNNMSKTVAIASLSNFDEN